MQLDTVAERDAFAPRQVPNRREAEPRAPAVDAAPPPPLSSDKDTSDWDAATWTQKLNKYRSPRRLRAVLELATTAIPFALAWAAMLLAIRAEQYWLYALLLIPTGGLLVRLFIIQHDCGHGAFLPAKKWNDWIGRVIAVLTLTPYDHWRRSHSIHHATSGNLDRRGVGDLGIMTVAEYEALSPLNRILYRAYRHPIVLFGIGPAWHFLLCARIPLGFLDKGWRPWASTMAVNVFFALGAALMISLIGFVPFVMIHIPVVVIAATIGVWLFYVQHQFEQTYWHHADGWSLRDAAMIGSSHYDLPAVLRWFTGNIGIHHVHHMSSRIPFYRLPDVLRDFPDLRERGRLTLLESLKCARLALWDEHTRLLISFRDLQARA